MRRINKNDKQQPNDSNVVLQDEHKHDIDYDNIHCMDDDIHVEGNTHLTDDDKQEELPPILSPATLVARETLTLIYRKTVMETGALAMNKVIKARFSDKLTSNPDYSLGYQISYLRFNSVFLLYPCSKLLMFVT